MPVTQKSIRRWHVSVTLITGALIAPRALETWVNGPTRWKHRGVALNTKRAASNENSVDAEDSPDWRRFRARLLEREAALTEATATELTVTEDWIHRSPLIEKGSVLLAKPGEWSVMFPCFHKAVILITDHDDSEYSRGLVLNRPTPGTEAYGRLEFNVWYGGPCQRSGDAERPRLGAVTTQRQFCLHGEALPGSDLIAPGVYMTEPWAASRSIMEGKAHVDDFMLLDGHCMWGPGQLQAELDDGKTWEMVAMDSKAILRFLPRQQRAMRTRKLSRGLPLWRRLYRRVSGTFSAPSAVERQGDQELLRFVHEELDVKHRTSSKSSVPPPGTPPHWQDLLRQALYHMQQESAAQQENACEALRNLIVDQDSRSFASSLGAIDLVLAAMKAHQDAPGVQGHCAGTLTHLAAGPLEREVIFGAQGLETVVRGMKQHESASLVQYKACAVLANLAADLESQLLVGKSGAIQRILRGMERHLNEQLVQDYCIGALFNLSRAPENMLALALAGGEQVVKAALKIHPEAPTVRQVGQVLAATLEAAKR